MAFVYALSDIHGCLMALDEALLCIDLDSNRENILVFCGDYIDYGPQSFAVIDRIRNIKEQRPTQIVALRGNHDQMFLDFLLANDRDILGAEWINADKESVTARSFLSLPARKALDDLIGSLNTDDLFRAAKLMREDIRSHHPYLIRWLSDLPLHYETDAQIFVHAGIDEEAEDLWSFGTPDELFLSKYPPTFGSFYKDIVAGHIGTHSIRGNETDHRVYWDGRSHYYIDGGTATSGLVPILKYDTVSRKYSSFHMCGEPGGEVKWREYFLLKEDQPPKKSPDRSPDPFDNKGGK